MTEDHMFKERETQPEAFLASGQIGDTLLFQTPWMSVKATKYGFHFAERAGRDSIALFLLQRCEGDEPRVLVRWQRSAYGEDRDKNEPGPITGSIDKPISLVEHAVQEAYEEAGFRLRAEDLILLTRCASSTQSNERCFFYVCTVSNQTPREERERLSWEPLSFLRSCEYATCQLGYFLIREYLSLKECEAWTNGLYVRAQ